MKLEALLQRLEDSYASQIPFVAYHRPYSSRIAGLFQIDTIPYDLEDYNQKGFVFAPFDTAQKTLFIPLEFSEHQVAEFSQTEARLENKVPEIHIDSDAKKEHFNLIEKGIDYIKQGSAKKIVLSRNETIALRDFSVRSVFEKLLHYYPSALVYVWFHPKSGLWMGATPETLLSVKENKFSTMALAGTQAFKGTTNIHWHQKEKDEQQYVTDYIRLSAAEIVKELEVSKPQTIRAGNLLHLKTDLRGTLRKKEDLSELIMRLHPTPAVCGVPKNNAQEFIRNNEGYDREYYTGFLGELNLVNGTNLFVNLRCMKLEQNQAKVFVGGGVTVASTKESEWQETVEKSKTIKKALAIR